jgi:uncharacterized membrane protein YfcA
MVDLLPVAGVMLAAGIIGGVLAGLLGVGGGIVVVPTLELLLGLLGVDGRITMNVAVATSMATIIPTSISSSRSHARRGAVDFQIARRWLVPIIAGALAGAATAARVDSRLLALVFGGIAAAVALKMLLPLEGLTLRRDLPAGRLGAWLPFSIGAVSSMMGIGGGTVSVPSMTLCGQPIHRAVGTASLLGLWISVPATLGYLLARPVVDPPPLTVGYVSLVGFGLIAPATWLAAPLGARLAHNLSRRVLSQVFGIFLVLVAIRMLYRSVA